MCSILIYQLTYRNPYAPNAAGMQGAIDVGRKASIMFEQGF